jgi:hypothetical protein
MSADRRAAIALFLYKRPGHARRAIDSLRANTLAADSDLYVFSDGPRSPDEADLVDAVRALARAVAGFRSVTVVESRVNQGLASSIIGGVSRVFDAHSRVIVIEDDLVTSPKALEYFNTMLDRFEKIPAVHVVSGFAYPPHLMPIPRRYPYDVYFTPRINTWGWATWRDRWQAVDWSASGADEVLADPRRAKAFRRGGDDLPRLWRLHRERRIDTWAIRWDYHQFTQGGVALHPREPYVACLGLDGSGTHRDVVDGGSDATALSERNTWRVPARVTLNRRINWAYKDLYDRTLADAGGRRWSPGAWWTRIERARRRMNAGQVTRS